MQNKANRMKLSALLVLLLIMPVFGADWYVDPNGNDTGAGTEVDPFESLQKAVDSVENGDTVHLTAGKHTASGHFDRFVYFAEELGTPDYNNAKTFTVIGADANNPAVTRIFQTANQDFIYVHTDIEPDDLLNVAFHHIKFVMEADDTDDRFLDVYGGAGNFTFNNCIIDSNKAGSDAIIDYQGNNAESIRNCMLSNSVVDANGNRNQRVGVFNDTGTVTFASNILNDVNDITFVVTGQNDILNVHDNTINGRNTANTDCEFVYMENVEYDSTDVWIYDNNCTGLRRGIFTGDYTDRVLVANNRLTFSSNTPTVGIKFGDDSNVAAITSLGRVLCYDNYVRFDGSSGSHGILIGLGADHGEYYNNTSINGNFQIVVKGIGNLIHHNYAYGQNTLLFAGGQDNTAMYNTCYATSGYALSWNKNGGHTSKRNPNDNIIMNNIFAGNGTDFVIKEHFGGSLAGSILNYNCYYDYSTANLITFDGTTYSSIAAIQATGHWIDWKGDNIDANSIVADPQFIDPANGDFRLDPNSPCLNAGKPTILSGYTNIGAWQGKSMGFRGELPANCYAPLEMDFNNDCKVDFLDMAIFSQSWLECNLD